MLTIFAVRWPSMVFRCLVALVDQFCPLNGICCFGIRPQSDSSAVIPSTPTPTLCSFVTWILFHFHSILSLLLMQWWCPSYDYIDHYQFLEQSHQNNLPSLKSCEIHLDYWKPHPFRDRTTFSIPRAAPPPPNFTSRTGGEDLWLIARTTKSPQLSNIVNTLRTLSFHWDKLDISKA